MHDNITKIGYYAFRNTNISISALPSGLREIGPYAFANCKNITEMILPEGLEKIEARAFMNSGLTKITIPDSVTSISDDGIFASCTISEIRLPEGLTGFTKQEDRDKISLCESSALTKVYLPAGFFEENLGQYIGGVNTEFGISPENPYYRIADGCIYTADMKTLCLVTADYKGREFTLPDSVQSIAPAAFALKNNEETGLTRIYIGDNITDSNLLQIYKSSTNNPSFEIIRQ